MEQLKCVVVGDGSVGKTALLISYTSNAFPREYIPTVFDNYSTSLRVDDSPASLGLWDTAGQEDYDRLRVLSYEHADVFLLCFAIDNRKSYENLIHKWKIEVAAQCPKIPFLIVGLKVDLRLENSGFISVEEGQKMCKLLGATCYVECSALAHTGMDDVFSEAVRSARKKREADLAASKRGKCCIM